MFENAELTLTQLEETVKLLRLKFDNQKKITSEFLEECGCVGITKVAIRKVHKSVPSSIGFPFGAGNSVFAFQPKSVKSDWPPIWGVVNKMNIGGACGNSDQHQLGGDDLIDGVYHLKKGRWIKVDEDKFL